MSDLPTNNVLIPPTIFLARQGGRFPTVAVKKRFIRWLYLAGLWARYSGATETKLQQDTALVTGNDLDPTHELEAAILRERGRVVLEVSDLAEAGINSAAARLSRIAARGYAGRGTGLPASPSTTRGWDGATCRNATTSSRSPSAQEGGVRQQPRQKDQQRTGQPRISHPESDSRCPFLATRRLSARC